MENENETVYNKYKILDAKTGEEKHGTYFVLKLDSDDPLERVVVKLALKAYAECQKSLGRENYAMEVMRYVKNN